jgi:hypothetical protein
MSRSLYWRLIPKTPEPMDVPADVVDALRSRYWEDDWGRPRHEPTDLDKRDVSWLEGLRDAGLEGANELIIAIFDHDTIRLTWE